VNHGKDGECKHKQNVSIDLNDVIVERQEIDANIILDETQNIGVRLRLPTYNDIATLNTTNKSAMALSLIKSCTEYIFQNDEVFYPADFGEQEFDDFFKGCSSANQLSKIVKFFDAAPKLVYNLKWSCAKCGIEDEVRLEGLQTFLL
jgi:hypothetical protein